MPRGGTDARARRQAPVQLSAELQDLLGCGETLPRTEMVKQLWAYIKANELQNPKNKSEILPDSKMKPVFGSKPFTVPHLPAVAI